MRVCKVCGLPKRTRAAIDRALVAGKTFTWIADKFSSEENTVSRCSVFRHSRHALALNPAGQRPRNKPPEPDAAKSLLDRVENLVTESKAIAAEAKSEKQWVAATSALREVRCCIELLGKLSGELSTSINFNLIQINENNMDGFLNAVSRQGPLAVRALVDEVTRRFPALGPPPVHVHFPPRPDRTLPAAVCIPAAP